MWNKTLVFSVIWAGLPGHVFGDERHEGAMTPQELIQGVAARSDAIFSGKLDYRKKSGFRGNAKKNLPAGEYRAILSGSSWRLYSKYAASEIPVSSRSQSHEPKLDGFLEITDLSHRGKSVKYNVTPQSDGAVRNSADITKEKPISSLTNTYNGPPVFAGSFWFDCTKQFVQSHKDKAVRKPDAEVNGVKVHVLEWEVSDDEKFMAFHSVSPTFRGGFLRLYVSPELGFVLPRIEHVGSTEGITASFDASEFTERAPGIFIPRHCVMQNYDRGDAGFWVEYEITDATQINEPIADNEFVIQLPAGTVVADSRNGKSSTIFEIQGRERIPGGLEDVIAVQPTPVGSSMWSRNWRNALLAGIGGGLLLLVAVYAFSRRFILRRRNP